jgi:zinc/manganese transport system substrate-binding protein
LRGILQNALIAGMALLGSVASLPALAAGPIQIVAAENFYADLATQIGGSHVSVTSILSNPDDDPHLFESSASTARSIAGADIVIYNGADYDPWMEKLLSASTASNRAAIIAADLIGKKSGDNPHIWYNPATFPAVASALAADLVKRDPADAAEYQANLTAFRASFAQAMKGADAIKSAYAGTVVTATEPVFGYMADALGLKMLNYGFQVDTMNETEPSASEVAAFENSLKDGSAKILFYNNQVTDDTTNRLLDLAKAGNVPVIGVTETEPAGQTIQSWFSGQIAAVEASLKANH